MQPATVSVRIKRPRGAVHDLLADLSRNGDYLDHFLVDWTLASDAPRGLGAATRMRATGGGGDAEVELVVNDVSPERIVEEARGGRRGRRRMRLTYELADVSEAATQVTFTLELLAGSLVDRTTWPLTRTHLERQFARAMLRLKGLLEGEPGAS